MNEQLEFLKLVTGRLDALGVPYMLSGSMALSLYAEPRMTRDLDLVVELDDSQVSAFVAAFSDDCYIDERSVRKAVQQHDMFNIIHNAWVIKADFIVRKDVPYRHEEFSRRQQFDGLEFPLTVVTAEDLLLSKLRWASDSGSELQQRDIVNLLHAKPQMDWEYVHRWAASLRVLELLEKLRDAANRHHP